MTSLARAKPSLRPWQLAALTEWRGAGHRGIVAAATGTGKTRIAVEALDELADGWVGVVVVPTKALQTQWIEVLTTQLGVHPSQVGRLGGDAPEYRLGQKLLICVLNSARERLPALVEHWRAGEQRTLLVVDECHRAGAPATAGALWSTTYDATLGLSATPERGEDGLDDVLRPSLGEVVYRYPLIQALDDGLLAPLTVANLYVDLSRVELSEYSALESQVGVLVSQGANEDSSSIQQLRRLQRRVVGRAGGRLQVLEALATGGLLDGRRALIFHETIEQAERTGEILEGQGREFALEHSKLSSAQRATALRRFAMGSVDCLVTVRALDEGIDVPSADLAVIVSGTMNPRQRIQRAGRIVRPSGKSSLLVSLLAIGTTEELAVGGRDAVLFGTRRVNHIANWDRSDPQRLVQFLSPP